MNLDKITGRAPALPDTLPVREQKIIDLSPAMPDF